MSTGAGNVTTCALSLSSLNGTAPHHQFPSSPTDSHLTKHSRTSKTSKSSRTIDKREASANRRKQPHLSPRDHKNSKITNGPPPSEPSTPRTDPDSYVIDIKPDKYDLTTSTSSSYKLFLTRTQPVNSRVRPTTFTCLNCTLCFFLTIIAIYTSGVFDFLLTLIVIIPMVILSIVVYYHFHHSDEQSGHAMTRDTPDVYDQFQLLDHDAEGYGTSVFAPNYTGHLYTRSVILNNRLVDFISDQQFSTSHISAIPNMLSAALSCCKESNIQEFWEGLTESNRAAYIQVGYQLFSERKKIYSHLPVFPEERIITQV